MKRPNRYGIALLPVAIVLVTCGVYLWADFRYISTDKENWVDGGLLMFAYWAAITILALPAIGFSLYRICTETHNKCGRTILFLLYASLTVAAYYAPMRLLPLILTLKESRTEPGDAPNTHSPSAQGVGGR